MSAITFADLEPASPPATLGYRFQLVEAIRAADQIMREHGAVSDGKPYAKRHLARWRAQRLKTLLVEMEVRERWELAQRVWHDVDGWHWAVLFLGGSNGNSGHNAATI